MNALLATLLASHPSREEVPSIDAWRARFDAHTRDVATLLDKAFVGGFHADRLGYAFAAGYHCALHALVPTLDIGLRASFCATESAGAHPRSIATRLAPLATGGHVLDGEKRFSTLASQADVLLVVASRGVRTDGRNDLVLVSVPAHTAGLRIDDLPAPPFAPEIPHARVVLEHVSVAPGDVLPGDGYAQYVKPFRTVEDLYVHASLLGHLVRIARMSTWPRASIERAVVLVAAIRALGGARADSPPTHVALAGVIAASREWLATVEPYWGSVDPVVRERWMRDQPLLGVAENARTRRAESAWLALERNETHGAGT